MKYWYSVLAALFIALPPAIAQSPLPGTAALTRGRLTNEAITGDPVAANNGNLSYLLDAVANRTSLISTLAALSNQTFNFDANDRITADTSDANGNTLTSNGKTYTYDFLDRLTTATGGITLVYDGDGNRVARAAGGVTTRYLIDDLTPLGYTQVAEDVVNNAVARRYVYGLQRISQTQGGATTYYLYDGGGTARGLADHTGSVTDTFTFDAFGNLAARTGSTPNDMLYRGEQFDAGLGLYYLRARWYNPATSRFLTVDKYEGDSRMLCCQTARLQGLEEMGPATFLAHPPLAYTHHEPVNFVDPSGLGTRWKIAFTFRGIRYAWEFHPGHHFWEVAGRILFCAHLQLVRSQGGRFLDRTNYRLPWCRPNRWPNFPWPLR